MDNAEGDGVVDAEVEEEAEHFFHFEEMLRDQAVFGN